MSAPHSELRLSAVEIQQGARRTLYAFGIDGKIVHQIAAVSRVRRNGETIEGYQRPEILSHIAEIRGYLESPDPMIPNAVVIAFDSRVRFDATAGSDGPSTVRSGTLVVPISSEPLPGFVVDGQQRLAAIRDSSLSSFPVVATAFITDDLHQQTEQFILVNATKPLPKSLIYELLPGTAGHLPSHLRRRRLPSILLDRLNRDDDSPFKARIQTATTVAGLIKDNSVLRMLEHSLSDGALYRIQDRTAPAEPEALLAPLKAYWRAVAATFPEAWDQPPKRSRLMHGAGIVAMGFLMDAVADRTRREPLTYDTCLKHLAPIRDACRWTSGFWDFGPGQQRRWNELQNTNKDVQLLSNYLLSQYKSRVWSRTRSADGDGPGGFDALPLRD